MYIEMSVIRVDPERALPHTLLTASRTILLVLVAILEGFQPAKVQIKLYTDETRATYPKYLSYLALTLRGSFRKTLLAL